MLIKQKGSIKSFSTNNIFNKSKGLRKILRI